MGACGTQLIHRAKAVQQQIHRVRSLCRWRQRKRLLYVINPGETVPGTTIAPVGYPEGEWPHTRGSVERVPPSTEQGPDAYDALAYPGTVKRGYRFRARWQLLLLADVQTDRRRGRSMLPCGWLLAIRAQLAKAR